MRYAPVGSCLLLLVLVACSAARTERVGSNAGSETTATPTVSFSADWTQSVSAPLVGDGQAQVAYDARRLATCRDGGQGGPAWAITGYYSLGGLAPTAFSVAGVVPKGTPAPPVIALPFAGDLQMWFENDDASGCHAWDSAYGANYRFRVAPPANAPGWVGNGASLIDRASCGSGNGPCFADEHPLDAGFAFDTWARTQAIFTRVYFQVWKAGVTDFDNPDLWKDLDVELHRRIGDQADMTTSYVDFDQRLGDNAQYFFDLRSLDPLPGLNGGALTDKSQCPTFPMTRSTDGQYLQADVQFYVTVNGVAMQPATGGVFHGLYSNYAGLYAICN